MYLFIVGGDASVSQSIHNSLSFLNRNSNFHIENICYLYYELVNRVIIVKSVSMMLSHDEEDQGKKLENIFSRT